MFLISDRVCIVAHVKCSHSNNNNNEINLWTVNTAWAYSAHNLWMATIERHIIQVYIYFKVQLVRHVKNTIISQLSNTSRVISFFFFVWPSMLSYSELKIERPPYQLWPNDRRKISVRQKLWLCFSHSVESAHLSIQSQFNKMTRWKLSVQLPQKLLRIAHSPSHKVKFRIFFHALDTGRLRNNHSMFLVRHTEDAPGKIDSVVGKSSKLCEVAHNARLNM